MPRTAVTGRIPASGRVGVSKRISLGDFNLSLLFKTTYFTVPVVPATTGFSIAFWLYRSVNGNNERIVDCTDAVTGNNGFNIFFGNASNNDKIEAFIKNNASFDASLIVPIKNGNWYHVVLTFAPNAAKFYLNGVLQASDTSCAMTTPTATLTVGCRADLATGFLNTYMDDFVFKNGTPFTQTEINDLYRQSKIPTGTNVYYDFESDIFATTIPDKSGNGNDATISIGSGVFDWNPPRKNRNPRTWKLYPDGSYDVFILGGQSNCSGKGSTLNNYTNLSLFAAMLGNDYVYKDLIDRTDSSVGQIDTVSSDPTAGGSVWPLVATLIMQNTGRPILFVPCAFGGSSITQWQPGANHQDRTTLYGSMVYRTLQAQSKGTIRAILWWQGETDAGNSMSQATYNGYLDTLANNLYADTGVKLMACKFQDCFGFTQPQQQAIWDAIAEAWADNTNVLTGPDLSDISTAPDVVHLISDSVIRLAASRWGTTIINSGIL